MKPSPADDLLGFDKGSTDTEALVTGAADCDTTPMAETSTKKDSTILRREMGSMGVPLLGRFRWNRVLD